MVDANGGDDGWVTQRASRSFANVVRKDTNPAKPISLTAFAEKTVSILNKKKLNLVVTGLKETGSEASDSDLFVRLCEEFLNLKPAVVKSARLGKSSGTTNKRLLLVSLGSAEAANNILAVARRLRDVQEPYVKANIFINRDLTKEEAKASFEKRQGRRAKAAAGAAPGGSSAAAATGTTAAPAGTPAAQPATGAVSQTSVPSTPLAPGVQDAPRAYSSTVQGDSSSGAPAAQGPQGPQASVPAVQSTALLQGSGCVPPRGPRSSLWSDDVDERQGATT